MKSIIRLAFYSLAAMIITACGGGGGGGGGGPVGPVVTATDPANGATQVPTAKTPITATFSVPVAGPDAIFTNITSAFTLKAAGNPVPVSGTIAAVAGSTTQWAFTPAVPNLAPGTVYTATIKKGAVMDLANPPHFMAADYTWSFTTSAWNGTQQLPSTNLTDKANGVATDSSGNIYVTGSTKGGLDTIPNANVSASQGFENTATYDVFLVKYDQNGVKLWTRLLGSAFNDEARGIAIDASDNIYVAGFTYGTLDVTNPNPNPGPSTGLPPLGTSNAFVAKYNTTGTLTWIRQSGTALNNKAYGVAVDAAGTNVYVAGETGDTAADPTSGDIFLAQFSSAGVLNWNKTLASTTAAKDRAYGVSVNGGNIYVAGFTDGVLTGTPAGTTNQGGADLFVAQFGTDAANAPVWVRQLGTAADDYAFSVATDASGVYAAGSTGGGLDGHTSAGLFDAFVVKYDAAGTKLWSNQLGTTGDDDAFGIAIDASGNAYITGDTEGVLPGVPAVVGTQAGFDFYVAKLNAANGSTAWVRQQGSLPTSVNPIPGDYGNAIAFRTIGTTSSLYVVGDTFGLMPGVNGLFSNADPTGNTTDFFLTRYDTTGVLFN